MLHLCFCLPHLKDNLKMLDAVRFCLIEKHMLQRLHNRLKQCPLKDSVSAALRYHEQELLQPVLQTPLTQPRSTFHCILGFGGMFSSSSLAYTDHLFQVFHPSWGEWRSLTAAHTPRMSNQGIAVLNNFVYLIGGDMNTSGFHAETRCWRWEPIIRPLWFIFVVELKLQLINLINQFITEFLNYKYRKQSYRRLWTFICMIWSSRR